MSESPAAGFARFEDAQQHERSRDAIGEEEAVRVTTTAKLPGKAVCIPIARFLRGAERVRLFEYAIHLQARGYTIIGYGRGKQQQIMEIDAGLIMKG